MPPHKSVIPHVSRHNVFKSRHQLVVLYVFLNNFFKGIDKSIEKLRLYMEEKLGFLEDKLKALSEENDKLQIRCPRGSSYYSAE